MQIAGFAGEPAGDNAAGDFLDPAAVELGACAAMLKWLVHIGHSIGRLLGQLIAARPDTPFRNLMMVD